MFRSVMIFSGNLIIQSVRLASGRKKIPRVPPNTSYKSVKNVPSSLTSDNEKFIDDLIKYKQSIQDVNVPITASTWTPETRRCGVLATKVGLVPQWLKDGKLIYTTVLQVLDNHVVDYLNPEKCKAGPNIPSYVYKKYGLQTVGAISSDPRMFSDSYRDKFERIGLLPKYQITRFIVTPEAALPLGAKLRANHFQVGHHVNAEAVSVDRGFQGVMKRWGFSGGPAGHGSTKFHRRAGAVYRGPGQMLKGTKMPGHMGNEFVRVLSLKIWRIIPEKDLIFVSGPGIPGPNHSFVKLWDCMGADTLESIVENKNYPHVPTNVSNDNREMYDESLFAFSNDSITF